MSVIATIISVIFAFLSILHMYWAGGGKAGISKVIPVVEGESAIAPGKIITLLVSFSLLGIAAASFALAFMNIESHSYGRYFIYAGWFLSFVFLVRAIGDFKLVGFFKKHKGSEFAVYDTKYYSPFCLLVSAVFALLVVSQG